MIALPTHTTRLEIKAGPYTIPAGARVRFVRHDGFGYVVEWEGVGFILDPKTLKKIVHRTEVGMIVSHRVAKETGATIVVEKTGPGSWIEQEDGWATLCLNHSFVIIHPTRALAMWHSAAPSGWCGDCERIADGKAPRITTGKVL